jgi:hypothetical protein
MRSVLTPLLSALAFGGSLSLKIAVEHHDRPYRQTISRNKPNPA